MCAVASVVIGLMAGTAQAHPVHASMADMEWNPKAGHYEVALQVQVSDLESAMSTPGNKPFRASTNAAAVKAMVDYVTAHFSIEGPQTKHVATPVGVEIGPRVLWLYFTWSANRERAVVVWSNLFFGLSARQMNTVTVTERLGLGERVRLSHVFTAKEPSAWRLTLSPTAAEAPASKSFR